MILSIYYRYIYTNTLLMVAGAKTYEFNENHSEDQLMYLFVSEGKDDIVKAIQYTFVGTGDFIPEHPMYKRGIYNLGFGDFDPVQDKINDKEISNNGDHYTVFNTVLTTIPMFFDIHKGDALMVNGSDSGPDFVEKCKESCSKKCGEEECKNFNRRLNLYKRFVDKNMEALSVDYQFFGGTKSDAGKIEVVDYDMTKKYDYVFLFKK